MSTCDDCVIDPIDDDCVVCFESTRCALTPCTHKVCMKCAERWFAKTTSCPICRATITGIESHESQRKENVEDHRVVNVKFDGNEHAGVRVNDALSKAGVVVTWLHKNDLFAHAGVRLGDTILAVNNIRAACARVTIALIEANKASQSEVCLKLLKERRQWRVFRAFVS